MSKLKKVIVLEDWDQNPETLEKLAQETGCPVVALEDEPSRYSTTHLPFQLTPVPGRWFTTVL